VNRKARVKRGPKAGKVYMARMASEDALRYRQMVYVEVRQGHRAPPRLSGRLSIAVLACPPNVSRTRDLDNYFKLLLDSLRRAGVIEDDSLFDHEEIFRGNPIAGGRLLVSIGRYDPAGARFSLNEVGLPGPAEVDPALALATPF
jgi:crossover junction endodeoxyribonuclease RusA